MHRYVEILLGLGLGLGYLTSFRLIGPVGIPEITILLCIVLLSKKHLRSVFNFNYSIESNIKLYFFFSIFLVAPMMTFVTYFFSNYGHNVAPEYLISFMMGFILLFLLREALKTGFDLRVTTLFFAGSFVFSNFIAIFIFPIEDQIRYTGGANNPNQLLFYAWALSLLLVVYQKKIAWVLLPIIVFILMKTKSDAYIVSLVVVVVNYFLYKILVYRRFSYYLNLSILAIAVTAFSIFIIINHSDDLATLWVSSDEGGTRVSLMWNGLLAALTSPVLGWGVGAFSGVSEPFSGSEAHNSFLDLSMQFGFIFGLVVHGVIFAAWIKAIKNIDLLVAALIVGFLFSGLFHFPGRHFVFWVELAVFLSYISNNQEITGIVSSTRLMISRWKLRH